MSEEPEPSIRTIHAIIEERDARYNQRFTDMERALMAALAASEKAIIKAETATEKRFESVNEFRTTLSDQAATFMTRTETASELRRISERINGLVERIDAVNKTIDTRSGKSSGLSAGWLYLLGAVAAIGTIVSLFLALRGA